MTVRVINADVLDGLRQLADESVHCVVTSPPYWGLRDYGVDGQIGLEKTPAEFVSRMVEVFREVRRVLRSDGVCFMNLGDSYNNFRSQMGPGQAVHGRDKLNGKPDVKTKARGWGQLKEKDLCGIPWRVAFALQDDGWWLRQDIIWHKPNPMPESVTDRCTKAHEYIFHLTKSERYWWDQEAIKEPVSFASLDRWGGNVERVNSSTQGLAVRQGKGQNSFGVNEDAGRNKRSVWTIATAPFPEAHFATFPPELPETCIKAGCPKGGTVLDPFGGAGTTGLVADRLQRHAILIELNQEYAAMAERRVAKDRGALLEMMENCA